MQTEHQGDCFCFKISSNKNDYYWVFVDNEDKQLVQKYSWYYHPRGVISETGGKNNLLHRLLTGAKNNEVVKFLNNEKTDCRRQNLNKISRSELNKLSAKNFVYPSKNKYGIVPGIRDFWEKGPDGINRRFVVGSISVKGERFIKKLSVKKYGLDKARLLAARFRIESADKKDVDIFQGMSKIAVSSEYYDGNEEYENCKISPIEVSCSQFGSFEN